MKKHLLTLCMSAVIVGCGSSTTPTDQAPEKSKLTSGQVSLTLKKNQTTQTEVAEVFGAPNLVTNNAGEEEVWVYQKHATIANASSSSFAGGVGLVTILFGGIGGSSSSSTNEQSSRTMTLVIKFKEINGAKRVVDFSSRYSSF